MQGWSPGFDFRLVLGLKSGLDSFEFEVFELKLEKHLQ